MAAVTEDATKIALADFNDCQAGFVFGKSASWRSTSAETARAKFMDEVTRIATASGSCSAWASKSAAINRGSPPVAKIKTSVGPAGMSMAQSLETMRLA